MKAGMGVESRRFEFPSHNAQRVLGEILVRTPSLVNDHSWNDSQGHLIAKETSRAHDRSPIIQENLVLSVQATSEGYCIEYARIDIDPHVVFENSTRVGSMVYQRPTWMRRPLHRSDVSLGFFGTPRRTPEVVLFDLESDQLSSDQYLFTIPGSYMEEMYSGVLSMARWTPGPRMDRNPAAMFVYNGHKGFVYAAFDINQTGNEEEIQPIIRGCEAAGLLEIARTE